MKSKYWILILVIALTLMLSLLACAPEKQSSNNGAAKTVELTLVQWGPLDPGNPMEYPQKELEKLPEITDGRIKVRIVGGMDSTDAFDGVLRGVYDLGETPVRGTHGVVWDIPRIPGLFSSYEEADRLLYGGGPVGQIIIENARPLGSELLEFSEEDFRGISNNIRPIRKPSDVAGLKLRIPSVPLYITVWSKQGADPVSIAWAETYAALKLGTADGQENGPIGTFTLAEVQKYYTDSLWGYNIDAIHFNKTSWDTKVPEDLKEVIREFALQISVEQRKLSHSLREDYLNRMEAAGVEIIRYDDLTAEEKQAWADMGRASWADFEPQFGTIIMDKLREAVGIK